MEDDEESEDELEEGESESESCFECLPISNLNYQNNKINCERIVVQSK